ncbi:MAG: thiamine-phosphate kinase [Desulfomonile tiedjei]|nr:thiamine-phosphate kinase [Desulfomonile tiedjei]
MKLGDIGEFGFIDRIAPVGMVRPEGVIKGIGDDCAVMSLSGPEYLLVTTDLLVESVHFILDWAPAEIIGAKALTVNLSDIAACGGVPRDAFISIAIPPHIDLDWLDGLYRGLSDAARASSVNVLGGDTTRSKGHLVINVAVTGLVRPQEVLFRHTAAAGDIVVLTGPTGRSGAGCDLLLRGERRDDSSARSLIAAHLEPRAHLREARILAESGAATAAIDVSDGLSSDLAHLCKDSGLGAILREESIPVSPDLVRAGMELGKDPLDWVLHGGEDYVLLAAVKPEELTLIMETAARKGCTFFPIGEFVAGAGIELIRADGTRLPITPRGWDHFR